MIFTSVLLRHIHGAALDVDDRSDEEGQEDAVQPLTTAQVTVITEEGTPSEKMETFLVPMRAVGELTLVKAFSYP